MIKKIHSFETKFDSFLNLFLIQIHEWHELEFKNGNFPLPGNDIWLSYEVNYPSLFLKHIKSKILRVPLLVTYSLGVFLTNETHFLQLFPFISKY